MLLSNEFSVSLLSQLLHDLIHRGADLALIVDKEGTIHSIQGLESDKAIEHKSVFYILPEFSFQLWSQRWSELSTEGLISFECQVSFAEQNERKKLRLFRISDKMALMVCPSSGKTQAKAPTETLQFNYDEHSPNAVFHADGEGRIIYMNPRMSDMFPGVSEALQVDKIFLDTDLGPPLQSWSNAEKDRETVLEMVMKAPQGFQKGYARVSRHDKNESLNCLFRVEFLNQKDLRYYGNPVEGIMDELEKVSVDLESQKELLIEETVDGFDFEDIVTQSPIYKQVLAMAAQVADTNSTVLITGETGTGKELLCNSIFRLSDRSDQVLVKINCGAIPPELMESVFFGHEKGAFTGADKQKIGKFELAHGGTIFLDEIGELPINLQPKLLRVLQEGEIERVGNPMPIKVDVRIIAATNRDLENMVKQGNFRADLYYRLNVFPIYNIPLRERKEDIPPLVKHFIHKSNKKTGRNVINISKKDYAFLMKYDYPGNIRELENIIERGVILAKGDTIDLDFLHKNTGGSTKATAVSSFDDMQKKYFSELLSLTKGKVSGSSSASEISGINNKTLTSKLKKLGIDPKIFSN